MTRVLVIESAGNMWGSERSLLDMVQGSSRMEVSVCLPPNTALEMHLAKPCVPVFPYYVADLHVRSRLSRLRAAAGVFRACRRFRPDVIHLNQAGSYKVVLPAATLLGIPVVGHVRIFEDAPYLAAKTPNPKRLRGLIAISDAVASTLRQFRELDDIPVHRLYDGYAWRSNEEVTRSPGDRPVIACVGRIVPVKGQDILVEALTVLKNRGTIVDCLMMGAGDGEFIERLKGLAYKGGVSSIRWLGYIDNTVEGQAGCDLAVCPSHREPLGRVVLEAWDAGVPPIVFAGSGGAAEIVEKSRGGFLYEKQTPEALAATIELALATPPGEKALMVDRGRSWLRENCAVDAYAKAISDILTAASRP